MSYSPCGGTIFLFVINELRQIFQNRIITKTAQVPNRYQMQVILSAFWCISVLLKFCNVVRFGVIARAKIKSNALPLF